MMNKKGQALIEFIIILPIVIYLIMGIVDFILIFNHKNDLESKMGEVVTLYDSGKKEKIESVLDKELFNYTIDNEFTKLSLDYEYNFITPGLDLILGKPYIIKCERVVLNE